MEIEKVINPNTVENKLAAKRKPQVKKPPVKIAESLSDSLLIGEDTNSIEYKRKKDSEPIRGIFRHLETPGGTVEFTYYAYENDPVVKYVLEDEKIYTLPRGVARHLNVNTRYPIHSWTTDEGGRPMEQVGKMISRYMFQPLDFADVGYEGMSGTGDRLVITGPNWR